MTPVSTASSLTAVSAVTDTELAARLTDRLAEVERRLADAVGHTDRLADLTSHHLLDAGGKRTRPLLCLLTAELGAPTSEVLDAAVVVELTHLATLYHDDVMDDAPVRRGVAAAHTVWGNNVAILAGDLLFARASRVCAELGPMAVTVQAETFERLCLGQMHETVGPGESDAIEHYLRVLADKTASLIATACRFGAHFAGCDEETVDVVVSYGEHVGTAFQLADDVLDLLAPGESSGKTPGTDLREGVATMPLLILRRMAAAGEAGPEGRRILDLVDDGVRSDEALAEALGLLRDHAAMAEARSVARRRAADAVAALAPLPAGPVRDALAAVAEQLADRVA